MSNSYKNHMRNSYKNSMSNSSKNVLCNSYKNNMSNMSYVLQSSVLLWVDCRIPFFAVIFISIV